MLHQGTSTGPMMVSPEASRDVALRGNGLITITIAKYERERPAGRVAVGRRARIERGL
ncbi:MAG: hypothetical protein ACREWG_05275 [Gammaproteobacteria bacterium]